MTRIWRCVAIPRLRGRSLCWPAQRRQISLLLDRRLPNTASRAAIPYNGTVSPLQWTRSQKSNASKNGGDGEAVLPSRAEKKALATQREQRFVEEIRERSASVSTDYVLAMDISTTTVGYSVANAEGMLKICMPLYVSVCMYRVRVWYVCVHLRLCKCIECIVF